MNFAWSCDEWNILTIFILTNVLRIITIILTFDRKFGAMEISGIDGIILEISSGNNSHEEIILSSASSNGNDNFKRKPPIPNHDLLSTDADIKTKYILISLRLRLLCHDGPQEEPICHSRYGNIDATRAGLCSGDNDFKYHKEHTHSQRKSGSPGNK